RWLELGADSLEVVSADPFHNRIDRLVQEICKVSGIDPDPESQYDKRNKGNQLPQVEVGEALVERILELAEHDPLIEPQHLCRSQDDSQHGNRGIPPKIGRGEGPLQDKELADEAVQSRHTDRA